MTPYEYDIQPWLLWRKNDHVQSHIIDFRKQS